MLYCCSFIAFLIRTFMFCFDKLHFLLAVWDMLEQNFFGISDANPLVDNIGQDQRNNGLKMYRHGSWSCVVIFHH